MIFTPAGLDDAWLIDPDPHHDDRGFFARFYCNDEFAEHGLASNMVQGNISYTAKAGTIRGMHFQKRRPQGKLVQAVRGAVFDVAVDLRRGSKTFGHPFCATPK